MDNTFASPALQQPLPLGADIVLHSTTKYIGGHSDVVGGALLTNDEELDTAFAFLQNGAGAVPGPFDAYLTHARPQDAGAADAAAQRKRRGGGRIPRRATPRSTPVLYPGLPGHPGHEVAARQMSGFGGMVSVRMRGGPQAAHDFCSRTEVFILAESLGGVESLIEHPGAMTHASTAGSQLEVPDDLVRLSVGIEDRRRPARRSGAGARLAAPLAPPDAVIARFTSGSAVGYSSTQLPLAISPALACTHRQPRSLRLSSAPSPSTACNNEMIAAVGGAGGLRSNNADSSAERACADPVAVGQRPRIRVAEALGVQPNTPDLAHVLQVVGEVRPRCAWTAA